MVFDDVDWSKYKYVYTVALSKTGKTLRLQAKVNEWLTGRATLYRLVSRRVDLPISAGLFEDEGWLCQLELMERVKQQFRGELAVVLLIPTYLPTREEKALGVGVVPEPMKKAVLELTKGVPVGDVFVVGTGNRRFGPDYGLAAKIIAEKLGAGKNLVLTENDLWPPVG
jgi:hypothetical protein|nr:MAG TPA: NrdI Flavodoxin like [Caudoviricetes sp.]